jgi:hypothetical protein
LKPYFGGENTFALRQETAVPEAVVVDGQKEAHVEKILGRRVRISRGKEIEEWKVRWTGFSKAHDQWRTRDKLERGAPLQQLRDFEERRLAMEQQVRNSAAQRREHRRHQNVTLLMASGDRTMAQQLSAQFYGISNSSASACLPWEEQQITETGEMAYVTELTQNPVKPIRILVLFSGTGSVQKTFTECFPHAQTVSLDSDKYWRSTHTARVEDWEYWGYYPPGYFDVIWASPPCTQYSQARTTGGPPDLVSADACVERTLDIIEYLKPQYWFLENPKGRYPNALRFRPVVSQLPTPLFCSYCMYGEKYKKPTCIWTNAPPSAPLRECTTQTPCPCKWATGVHPLTAQLGPHPDQQGMKKSHAVYPIPAKLLRTLFQCLFSRKTSDAGVTSGESHP